MLLSEIYDIYSDINRPMVQVVAKGFSGDIYVNFQDEQLKKQLEEQTIDIIEDVLNHVQVETYQFMETNRRYSSYIIASYYRAIKREDHYTIREELTKRIHQLYISTLGDNQ